MDSDSFAKGYRLIYKPEVIFIKPEMIYLTNYIEIDKNDHSQDLFFVILKIKENS